MSIKGSVSILVIEETTFLKVLPLYSNSIFICLVISNFDFLAETLFGLYQFVVISYRFIPFITNNRFITSKLTFCVIALADFGFRHSKLTAHSKSMFRTWEENQWPISFKAATHPIEHTVLPERRTSNALQT